MVNLEALFLPESQHLQSPDCGEPSTVVFQDLFMHEPAHCLPLKKDLSGESSGKLRSDYHPETLYL